MFSFAHFLPAWLREKFGVGSARPPTPSSAAQENLAGNIAPIVELLRFHNIPADPARLTHSWGAQLDPMTVLRLFRAEGCKARAVTLSLEAARKAPMPALAVGKDRRLLLVGKIGADQVLTFDLAQKRPVMASAAEFASHWSGSLILVTPRAKKTAAPGEGAEERFGFRWFLRPLMKYRRLLGEVFMASLVLQLFALATPFAFQVLVDKVLVNRGLSTLDVVCGALLAIALFEALLGALRSYVFTHTTNRVDVELGSKLFGHLLDLPLAYFQSRRVGDSIARARELENIRQFLTGSSLTLVIELLFTVVFLGVMFAYSLKLTLIVLATLPLYVLISVLATPLFRTQLDEKFKRGAENQSFLTEAVSGVETIKSMAVEPRLHRKWEEQLAGYVKSSQTVANTGNVASQTSQGVGKLATAGLLWVGAHDVMGGALSVGGLVAFNMLSGRVSQPVLRLAQMYQDFHQMRLSVERVGDIFNTPRESRRGGASVPNFQGGIAFENVNYRHRPDSPLVLDDITLNVRPGEVIGLVGSSGSGKSTLLKLLQRLYVAESGRILADGLDLALVDPAWLRQRMGVVLQENVLFNMTLRENIALADPALPLENVVHAAKLAGAHDFILRLPEGYDTQVSERGASLSGGQRQRVAIARALVRNPRILIFDEATSALDYESENLVQRNLRAICAGRTVFITAHRLSAVRHADRIVVLENGKIVEQGPHEALLALGGRYAALHALQEGLGKGETHG